MQTPGLNVMGRTPDGAWSIAAALMSMIYALGDVSGAHFNPAVTVAILASGGAADLTPAKAGQYIAAQLLGGMAGALTYSGIHWGYPRGVSSLSGHRLACVRLGASAGDFHQVGPDSHRICGAHAIWAKSRQRFRPNLDTCSIALASCRGDLLSTLLHARTAGRERERDEHDDITNAPCSRAAVCCLGTTLASTTLTRPLTLNLGLPKTGGTFK